MSTTIKLPGTTDVSVFLLYLRPPTYNPVTNVAPQRMAWACAYNSLYSCYNAVMEPVTGEIEPVMGARRSCRVRGAARLTWTQTWDDNIGKVEDYS